MANQDGNMCQSQGAIVTSSRDQQEISKTFCEIRINGYICIPEIRDCTLTYAQVAE